MLYFEMAKAHKGKTYELFWSLIYWANLKNKYRLLCIIGSLAPAAKGKQAVAEGAGGGGGAGTTDADADLQARLDDLRRE